jgi:hypothetical protein
MEGTYMTRKKGKVVKPKRSDRERRERRIEFFVIIQTAIALATLIMAIVKGW